MYSATCSRHGHWVCRNCSENGLCKEHGCSCINTHALWFNIVTKLQLVQPICEQGCVASAGNSKWHSLAECPLREHQFFTFANNTRIRGYARAKVYACKHKGLCTADGTLVMPGKAPFTAHVLMRSFADITLCVKLPFTTHTLTLLLPSCRAASVQPLTCSADTSPALLRHAATLWRALTFSA